MSDISNSIEVTFRISGSAIDIVTLDKRLKLVEGEVIKRPASVPVNAMSESWWAIDVKMINQESTEDAIMKILDMIEPIRDVITEIADDKRFKIELDCEIIINDDRPMIEVSAQTLKRVANINAELGFEIFDYRE